MSRSFRWGNFFARNRVLTAYVIFALVSVLWSDFPFPAFKKWFRDLGDYVMVLVAVSDPHPVEALRVLLRRLGYLLIPLSVVLIKYFPALARQYDPWTGVPTYCGATTSKNMLGELCLVCGIFFIWDTVVRWPNRRGRRQKLVILVNAMMMCMVIWLLHICDSATSRVCLVIASLVILAAQSKTIRRSPHKLTAAIPVLFLVYAFLFFGLGMSQNFANAVGRTSLSGRDDIWRIVLTHQANPLVGAGYESFWMGPRLKQIWAEAQETIGEAHNGYLEAYLNLGFVGVTLLLSFVVVAYRTICKCFRPFSSSASFAMALWTAFLFHNCTEADFRNGLMWIAFVLTALVVAESKRQETREVAALYHAQRKNRSSLPLEAAIQVI